MSQYVKTGIKRLKQSLAEIGIPVYHDRFAENSLTVTRKAIKVSELGDRVLWIYHSIDRSKWPSVNKVLRSVFPGRTLGIQTEKDAIAINTTAGKRPIKQYEKVSMLAIFYLETDAEIDCAEGAKQLDKLLGKRGYVDEYPAVSDSPVELNLNINKRDIVSCTRDIQALRTYGKYKVRDAQTRRASGG